jgi:predicted Zn-dependent peptidase
MGATLSISSNRNRTRLHALAPSTADIPVLIGLLGEMVANPDFDSAFEAERERHALRAGRAADNAAEKSQALFEETLYGDTHPFGRRPSPESVRSITPTDVRAWHETRLYGRPDNLRGFRCGQHSGCGKRSGRIAAIEHDSVRRRRPV